jgi:glycosyltransferase involved in cell wall biosynthesis
MIGDGHNTAALRHAAERSGLRNIQFRPYQDRAGLAQSLSVGDLHWISLRPELEGLILPSKVYGVLAAGRPVLAVTARDGEIARLVAEHGCGLQSDPGDAQTFAAAVRRLVADPDLARRLGLAARAAAVGVFSRGAALGRWREALGEAAAP